MASEDLPIVLMVEDDEAVQSIVEDALKEGGFETAIAPTAEEAVTLLKAKDANYRALVTDINLTGRMNGWGGRQEGARNRSGVSNRLHDGCRRE